MSLPIVLRAAARDEADEAARWYYPGQEVPHVGRLS